MDILQLLAADKEILLYRKELNNITKKVTATILLQQMIYWHSKMNGPFYKFIEPCKNEAYNEGDSWCEELGFSVKEFATAYKTLEDLKIVSKKINMNRVTYYHIDSEVIGKLLNGIYGTAETAVTQTPKGDLDITETTTKTTQILDKSPTNPPKRLSVGGHKSRKNKKVPTPADIADQHRMTLGMIEDYVDYRVNSGGIEYPIAFEKHVLCGLLEAYSDESVHLEQWFETIDTQRHIIDHLVSEFSSMHWFDRRKCRDQAKDDHVLKMHNVTSTDVVIEIAFQIAESKRREGIGGAA